MLARKIIWHSALAVFFLAAACEGGEFGDGADGAGGSSDLNFGSLGPFGPGPSGPGGSDMGSGVSADAGGFPGQPPPVVGVDATVSADAAIPTQDNGPPPVVVTVPEVDPGCIDGQYNEVMPTPTASLAPVIQGYQPSAYKAFIFAALDTRYPVGSYLIQQGLAVPTSDWNPKDCVDSFLLGSSSADQVLDQMSTLVHECGHFADIEAGGWSTAAFLITPDVTFQCGDISPRGFGANASFARSLLNGDAFAAQWPACQSRRGGTGCDSYASVYLDGDPNNSAFEGGDQGFDSLLEETVQYVNSLATAYAFNDQYAWSASERDGILTFLWYVERYLYMARNNYPGFYQYLLGDSCWREAILTVWGRAWLFLDATDGIPQLGIDDDSIIDLVRNPTLLDEIRRLRDAAGC